MFGLMDGLEPESSDLTPEERKGNTGLTVGLASHLLSQTPHEVEKRKNLKRGLTPWWSEWTVAGISRVKI